MKRVTLVFWVLVFLLCWCFWADQSGDIAEYFTEGRASNVTSAGSWGDAFGPFSTLISALGTVLLVITLMMQREATANQASDLYRQRFESSFYELLRLLREIRSELTFRYSPEYIINREVQRRSAESGYSILSAAREIRPESENTYFKGHAAIEAAVKEY